MSTAGPIGPRVRAARESRGLSVRQLAQASGRSASSISQIERGLVNPRVDTLMALAIPLGMTVAQLLSADDTLLAPVRKADRIELPADGRRREYLLTRRPFSSLEVYTVVLEPGGTSDTAQVTHGDSDEFVLVLRGSSLAFESGEDRHVLEEGDSIEFRSSQPHWVVNEGTGSAELLWAITPPTPVPHIEIPTDRKGRRNAAP